MKTDIEALIAMNDEDIDCSDIPELTNNELNNLSWIWEQPVISHEEATIRSFMRNPSRAEDLLNDAINDGDIEEVRIVWRRLKEARARMHEPVLEAAMA